MGWSVGYDTARGRDIGYGVPATCDYPDCGVEIDRGLSYVCGNEPYGGDYGCGLFFCGNHLGYKVRTDAGLVNEDEMYDTYGDDWESTVEFEYVEMCERCANQEPPFTPTPDIQEWIDHKMTDPSWAAWRKENGL